MGDKCNEAGSDCAESAERPIERKRSKHRTDIGEKMKCPKCGSDQVCAMSRAEMGDYLGGNRFVLSVPRKCEDCGHRYKAIPSRAGYAVLYFAVLATLGLVVWCALLSGLPLFAIVYAIACPLVLLLLFSLLHKAVRFAFASAWAALSHLPTHPPPISDGARTPPSKRKLEGPSRVRGPLKSKILAVAVKLAVLVASAIYVCLRCAPLLKVVPVSWIEALVIVIAAFAIFVSVWDFFTHGTRLSDSLKAPSADDVMQTDGRRPILYLRSFAEDTGPYPVHEQELVGALSVFGPVIAIGRPRESLQTLGAGASMLATIGKSKFASGLKYAAVVVIRIGESEGLRWEIDTVASSCKPTKVVLQVPGSLFRTGAIILDRLISRITQRNCHHDYSDVNYIYFDKSVLSARSQHSSGQIEQAAEEVVKLLALPPLRHKRPDFFLEDLALHAPCAYPRATAVAPPRPRAIGAGPPDPPPGAPTPTPPPGCTSSG